MTYLKIRKAIVSLFISCALAGLYPAFARAEGSRINGFDYTNYTELEYIQTDGNCYFNTELTFDAYSMDAKVLFPSLPSAVSRYIGTNSTSNGYFLILNASNNIGYAYAGSNRTGSVTASANTEYTIHTELFGGSQSMTVNNTSVTTSTSSAVSISYPILIAGNRYGATLNPSPALRIYYIKFLNSSSSMVKYYVPAKRNSDNVVGLYDVIGSSFLTKSGSGTVTGGNPVNVSYTVGTSVYPSGGGSVTGAGVYLNNSTATLTATPNTGYEFSKWTVSGVDYSTSNPLSLVVNSNIDLVANFLPTLITNYYNVTASVSPSGSGSVSGAGTYQEGSEVTLTASAASGYVFDHWSNLSTTNPLILSNLSDDQDLTAYFVESSQVTTYTVNLTVDPSDSGTVTGGGTLQSGTTTSLSATPAANYSFSGWYSGTTLLSSSNPFSLLVDGNYNITAKFSSNQITPLPTWTDWTDENDTVSYINITDEYSDDDISLQIIKRLVVDGLEWESDSGVWRSSNDATVAFTGYYYDNSIYGLTACNSTTTSHTTTNISAVSSDTVYINLNYDPVGAEPGFDAYFGLTVDMDGGVVNDLSGSTTSNTFQNTSQACQIMGTNPGDSTLDGSMLYDLGYVPIGLESDIEGVEALIWVPGNEEISFSTDDLGQIFNGVRTVFTNLYRVSYHYEYDVYLLGSYMKALPSFGKIESKLSMYQFLNYGNFGNYMIGDFNEFKKERYTTLPNSQGVSSSGTFRYTRHEIDGDYYYDTNNTKLFWSDTNHPEWHFQTQQYRGSLADRSNYMNIYDTNNGYFKDYTSVNHINNYQLGIEDSYMSMAITSDNVSNNSSFTAGTYIYVDGFNLTLYREKDNSILNRFNQLGSFLNTWFTRIYNSVSNITGGSESNDITNNITNDYDINVDTDINSVITNIYDKDDDIDLTAPEVTIQSNDLQGLQALSDIPSETVKVFTDNKIGILLFLPIVFGILRLIL